MSSSSFLGLNQALSPSLNLHRLTNFIQHHLTLHHQATQIHKNRARFRDGGNLPRKFLNPFLLLILYRYSMELTRIVLTFLDHPLLGESILVRNRVHFAYNPLLDWGFHMFYLYFTIIQMIFLLCSGNELWLQLANYLLVTVVQDYRAYGNLENLTENGKQSLQTIRAKEWQQIKRKFRFLVVLLEKFPAFYSSSSKVRSFAQRLHLVHLPNAPFPCKLAMMMVYVGSEVVNATMIAAGSEYTVRIGFPIISRVFFPFH